MNKCFSCKHAVSPKDEFIQLSAQSVKGLTPDQERAGGRCVNISSSKGSESRESGCQAVGKQSPPLDARLLDRATLFTV